MDITTQFNNLPNLLQSNIEKQWASFIDENPESFPESITDTLPKV